MVPNIMLVDDSAICNLIMKKTLARLPIEPVIHDFVDPVMALANVPVFNPDLIFLDLNMPELDGWSFLQRMQETNLPHRVIILTSSTSLVDRLRSAEFANVISYQTKPVTREFMNTLTSLITGTVA